MLWLFVVLALLAGLLCYAWSLKRNFDRGYRYHVRNPGVETSKTVELSPELQREGVGITSFGTGCEMHGFNFLRRERRRVFLTIEPEPDPSAAALLYTLYGADSIPLSSGKLRPSTDVDDLTSETELIVDNDKAFKVGSNAACVKSATHLILDDNLWIATRVVIHR
jgi:hypothetical protein